MPNTNDRQFSYADPVSYNGSLFPSSQATIYDNGSSRVGKVFADAGGQYYYLNDSGTPVPAMLSNTLDEVVVTPSQQDMLANAFGSYLTMSNDRTKVSNVPHREHNPHLQGNAIRGAKYHAQWEKEHPNASSWAYAASAAPFAVAATPLALGAGDALAGTALGQATINGANAFMANPLVEMANTATGLGFGVKGAVDIANGEFTPGTAMELMGLPWAAKNGLGLTRKYLGNRSLSGESVLPISVRKYGAERYTDFIQNPEYQHRLENAGLESHWDDMKDLANKRLNGITSFPGRMQETILSDPNTRGLSGTGIFNPYRGITIKRELYPNKIMPTLDHEISHWATRNIGIKDKGFLGDIMKYNEGITPNASWTDFLVNKAKSNPKMKIPEGKELEELEKDYNYLIDPQEKRARAYSIYQQAKDNNITTDEMIDMFTRPDGTPVSYAPAQLRQMLQILATDNLKRYLNNFLSIASPIGIGASVYNSNKQNNDRQ